MIPNNISKAYSINSLKIYLAKRAHTTNFKVEGPSSIHRNVEIEFGASKQGLYGNVLYYQKKGEGMAPPPPRWRDPCKKISIKFWPTIQMNKNDLIVALISLLFNLTTKRYEDQFILFHENPL